jgi:MFS family permease
VSSGAFALVSSLPDQAFLDWGWRLPFLASVVLLVVGIYIRLNITEPAAFKKLEDSGKISSAPVVDVFRHEKRKTFIMVFFQSIANVGYFLVSVYALTYVVDVLHLPRSWATTGLLIAAAVDLVTQPMFGALSDRIGRKRVYAFGAIFFALYAFPFFYLLDTGNQYLIWLAFTLGLGIGHASTGSLHGVIYAEQYPVKYRYSGSSIAYQLSGIVSSAPTPLIAAWLVNSTGSSQGVAWYIIAAALITLTCVCLVEETYRAPIDQ